MSRRRRIVTRVGLGALAAGLAALVGFVIWAENPMRAEATPLAAVKADPQFDYRETADTVRLVPRDPNGTGLLFLAGARVDAAAYAATFRGVADAGTTVVIVKPLLNFAIFEFRSPRQFEAGVHGVSRWFVGGHSLGGVKACQWAADGGFRGLVLLGSYCADDLSHDDIAVLSISGSRDGLSTPAEVRAARHLLPPDARMVQLRGASHAQFGAYGDQQGDGTPSVSDAEVHADVARQIVRLLSGAGAPGPAGAAGCAPASPVEQSLEGFPEVRATPSGGVRAYGLIMADSPPPFAAGSQVIKVVWRVTGSGPLRTELTRPDGTEADLTWGPEAHGGGSTYERPGEEWGTGFTLDTPGCWRMRLTRGTGHADVWFAVS